MPSTATPIAITARLGSARPMLATLIATNEPRWMCPSQTPSGSAITSDTPIAAALSSRCSTMLGQQQVGSCRP